MKISFRDLLEDCSDDRRARRPICADAARRAPRRPADRSGADGDAAPRRPSRAVARHAAAADAGALESRLIAEQLELMRATTGDAARQRGCRWPRHPRPAGRDARGAGSPAPSRRPSAAADRAPIGIRSVPATGQGTDRRPHAGSRSSLCARSSIATPGAPRGPSSPPAATARISPTRAPSPASACVWKEMVYPIVTDRSSGSRLWDVDGNEYIDLTNGFGTILFGHNPDFIREAVEGAARPGHRDRPAVAARRRGGARSSASMTGMERVAFCNTGSEAVTAAIRVARTVTGRDKIAMFAGAYHGIFDEVLVRPTVVAAAAFDADRAGHPAEHGRQRRRARLRQPGRRSSTLKAHGARARRRARRAGAEPPPRSAASRVPARAARRLTETSERRSSSTKSSRDSAPTRAAPRRCSASAPTSRPTAR